MRFENTLPPFAFFPRQLTRERKYIEKKYANYEEYLLKEQSLQRLPQLLKKIRALPMQGSAIEAFAKTLSRFEVRLLTVEYPYTQEEADTVQKIHHILKARYTRDVGRIAWKVYQNLIDNKLLVSLLQHAFELENEDFLGLNSTSRDELNEAFQYKEPVSIMGSYLTHSAKKAEKTLNSWKVEPNSLLEETLLYSMLLKGFTHNQIIDRESQKGIIAILRTFTLAQFQECIKVYVESRNDRTFHHLIVEFAVEKLGDPRENAKPWLFLSEESILDVKRYLNRLQLKKFFARDHNNERFHYWERYMKKMEDPIFLEKPNILIMYFDRFVVVEFADTGNAAYFYYRDGFDELILPRITSRNYRMMNTARKYSMFKDTRSKANGYPLFINKLSHNVSWKIKFERYMHYYLQGNFTI